MGKMGYSNLLTTKAQFIGEGKYHIISKFESIFGQIRRMGVRSPGDSI